MKHIHIVEPYHSAAMQRMSLPLVDLAKLYTVTTSEEIDDGADCNIHLPWHSLTGKDRGKSKHVIVYTHCNPNAAADLLDACERADIVTAMSYEGRRELVGLGVDPAKIWVNYCAASDFKFRRRLIGIVGYPQPNGRKREHMLLDMAWQYDLSLYEFLFVGAGWEPFVSELASLGVHVQAIHADTWETVNAIYSRLDALLVTGYVEGGPLPLLEAMAAGCKVFSPRFGYAADLLEDADLYSDLPDLMAKLGAYFEPCINNAMLARSWTWRDYAAEYAMLLGRLLGESVDLSPERGVSRYAQLLDVIDETRPQSIVEIGTWGGNTAARMIQQAAKWRPIEAIYYQGFDLFGTQTRADVRRELSKDGWKKSIVQKRLDATGAEIELVEGYTADTLIKIAPANLYFVDGGHSERTIAHDADSVLCHLADDETVIFDDYYHEGKPEGMGCNKVIDGLDREQFKVIFLPALTKDEKDGRVIGMVRVERRKENNADLRLQMPETTYAGSMADYRASVSWASS
jgi:hypothetical protein